MVQAVPDRDGSSALDKHMALGDRVMDWIDRRRWWLFTFVAAVMLAGFNGLWRIGADSSIYIEVARHVYEGTGYWHPTGFHRSICPGLVYLIAGTMSIAGPRSLLPAHILMFAIATMTLVINYRLFLLHAGRPTAVLVTVVLCLTETFYRYAFHLLPDLPFLTGLLLFLYGHEVLGRSEGDRRAAMLGVVWIAAGLFVMAVMRSVVIIVLAAWFMTLLVRIVRSRAGESRRYIGMLVCVLAALVAAHFLISPASDPTEFGRDEKIIQQKLVTELPDTLRQMVTKNIPKLTTEIAAEASLGLDWGPVPAVPVGLLILGCGFTVTRRNVLWGMLVIVFTLQWLLFIVTERYFLVIMPVLIFSCWWALDTLTRRYRRWWSVLIFVVAAVFWIGSNLVKIGNFVVEQRRTHFYAHYANGRYEGLIELGEYMREHLEDDALVIFSATKHMNILSCLGEREVKHRRRLRRNDFRREHLYLVQPVHDKRLAHMIDRRSLELGESLFTATRGEMTDKNIQPLTLHRLENFR